MLSGILLFIAFELLDARHTAKTKCIIKIKAKYLHQAYNSDIATEVENKNAEIPAFMCNSNFHFADSLRAILPFDSLSFFLFVFFFAGIFNVFFLQSDF